MFYNKYTKRDFGGRLLFFLDPGTRVSHKAPTFEYFSFRFRKYPTSLVRKPSASCGKGKEKDKGLVETVEAVDNAYQGQKFAVREHMDER